MATGIYGVERALTPRRLEVYQKYLESLDPHVEGLLQKFEQFVDAEAQQIQDEWEKAEYYEYRGDEHSELEEFRTILLNSFFAASFALFEHRLVKICQWADKHYRNADSVRAARHFFPMDKAVSRIGETGINFPTESREWKEILNYKTIRNKIMHSGGMIPSKGKTTSYAKENKIVYPPGENNTPGAIPQPLRLELTKEFCDEAIRNFEEMLLNVHMAFEEWIRKRRRESESQGIDP